MACRRLVSVVSVVLTLGVFAPAAPAQVLYVDDDAALGGDGLTWATAYSYLQDALAVALADDEIRVAQGTYMPDQDEAGNVTLGDREATFQLISGVALFGGYRGCPGGDCSGDPDERDIEAFQTILSGDLNGDDNSGGDNSENTYQIVTATGVDESTVLNGFTIRAGNANESGHSAGAGLLNDGGSPRVIDCTFEGHDGMTNTAIYSRGYGNPRLTNCTFRNNLGNVFVEVVESLNGGITLLNCDFRDNPSVGVRIGDSSEATLTDCSFIGSAGCGLLNYGEATLRGCTFADNLSGGLGNGGTIKVLGCVFTGNSTNGSGGAVSTGGDAGESAVLVNCLFTGNTADHGGALYSSGDSLTTVVNCSLSNNSADHGGGIYAATGIVNVSNCILWGNTDAGGQDESSQISGYSGTNIVNHSCVQGLSGVLGGTGNTGDDPLFYDMAGPDGTPGTADDDLRICAGSPCIDSGDNWAVPSYVATDLDGLSRFIDDPVAEDVGAGTPPLVDMGAFEYQEDCNENLIIDSVDLQVGTSQDCNSNAIPDECDIADGKSNDCDENGVPDECQPDCNLNEIADSCDISSATSEDENSDGIPDECQSPPLLYVDLHATGANDGTTWTDALNDLAEALWLARISGGVVSEIWVAAGTYMPDRVTGDREATFNLLSGLGLYGGFAGTEANRNDRNLTTNVTILSGDIGTPGEYSDNSSQVVTASSTDGTAVLDGFTITQALGHGLLIEYASPTISNCIISDNRGSRGSGLRSFDGSPTLVNCIVIGNWAADGGGGMSAGGPGELRLINCMFVGNSCGYLGWYGMGGGLSIGGIHASLSNCTFVGNWARGGHAPGGGILVWENASATLTNCILWDNWCDFWWAYDALGNSQITYYEGAVIEVGHSCVEGDWPGITNTDVDPLFADTGYWVDNGNPEDPDNYMWMEGDQRLMNGSSCIDAGDNEAVPADVADLDGDGDTDELLPFDLDCKPRIANGVVDIGAYEQADCNSNGIADGVEIDAGTSQDCNTNAILDECDIRDGTSDDTNGNTVPDECEQGACCDCPPVSGCLDATLAECNASGGSWASEATCGEITCPGTYPVNDEHLDAFTVTDGTYAFSTRCATTDGSPYVDCENGLQPFGSDVWYEYTATCAGDLTVSLCSATDYNAVIEVLPDGVDTALCPMVGADDTCGELYGPPSLHRVVSAGERYTIRIGGWNGMQGTGELSIACDVPSCVIATPPDSEPDGMDKPRYVSFTVNEAEASQAIRVSASDVPTGFEEYECTQLWVGEPREFCENAGQSFPPGGGCSEAPGLPTTFVAAALQCEPFYTDWNAWGTVHVYGDLVLPNGLYQIQAIAESCDAISEGSYSEPLIVATSRWGDLVTDCTTTPCGPPDGLVGIPTDVTAALDKFKNLPGAVKKVRSDLEPGMPDLAVNITDVVQALDAFRGFDYPFEPDGDPCGG